MSDLLDLLIGRGAPAPFFRDGILDRLWERTGYVELYLADRLCGREREAFEGYWFLSDVGFESLHRGLMIRAGFFDLAALTYSDQFTDSK